MHVHLPKPLHGWREFVGEVGIIVVGVLIALGAEQVVQDVHDRAEQRAFRETIDHEIGLNLYVYHVRARQFACDKKRADELFDWLARARAGHQVPVLYPASPITLTPYRSAWDNRNTRVLDELPAEQRQKYAEFYDELSNNSEVVNKEGAAWDLLAPYKEIGSITLADRRALRPVISGIDGANNNLQLNYPVSEHIAKVLNVKAVRPDNLPDNWLKAIGSCTSVIASPEATRFLNPPPKT
jgi:hypothetical protein